MELGLNKCAVIHIKKGKYAKMGGVILKSGGIIKELQDNESYKYLGIEELVGIHHDAVKEKIKKKAKGKLRMCIAGNLLLFWDNQLARRRAETT